MKKLTITTSILTALLSSTTFASIDLGSYPENFDSRLDYVGTIVAAERISEGTTEKLLIMTKNDGKCKNPVAGLTFVFRGNADMQYGYVFANSVGKKLAASFSGRYPSLISSVSVVTDEYYYGTEK